MARLRAHTSCERRDRRRRIIHVHRSGIHTPSSDPAANSLASVLASRRSVFARAWRMPVSVGLTTRTCATCGSINRAISHAFPDTSSATRSSGAKAPREQLDLLGLSLDPTGRAELTILDDRDLTEIQVHIQRD